MPEPRVARGVVWEGQESNFNDARLVKGVDGSVIGPSDLSGDITLSVYDLSSTAPNTAITVNPATFTAASLISANLVTWPVDDDGRNFRHQVLSSTITTLEGGKTYRFVYVVPITGEGDQIVIFEWRVRGQQTH